MNIVVLAIFFVSLGGILFIIGKKLFFLASIDLSQTPKEIAAKTKKELLKKRIIRQMENFKGEFKLKVKNLIDCFKKNREFLTRAVRSGFHKLQKKLLFLKNKIKFIKDKYEKRM